MVVVHHLGILSQEPSIAWMTRVSAPFAVQAFFVVSGFLVTMSFENSRSVRSYAIKRVLRIYPAYFVVVILAALAFSPFSTLSARDYFSSGELWRYLGFNLVLSNFVAPSLPGLFTSNFTSAVNGALWTIKIEVGFYCLVPLMVWGVRKIGYQRALVALFGAAMAWKWGFTALASASKSKVFEELAKQLPGQMTFFAGGAWAYYRSRTGGGIHGLLAVLGVLLYGFVNGPVGDMLQPLDVTAIVYWAALECPRLPSLGRYGDFSYGTYLYHFPLIQLAVWLGLFQASTIMAGTTVVIAVASCAVCSWCFVERPMLASRTTVATSP